MPVKMQNPPPDVTFGAPVGAPVVKPMDAPADVSFGAAVGGGAPPPSQPQTQPQGDGQHPNVPHEGMVDHYMRNAAWYDPLAGGLNLMSGIGAGVEETAAGVDRAARKVTGTKMSKFEQGLQAEAGKPVEGFYQKAGKAGEAVGEFFTGEELLSMLGKGAAFLSAGEKLDKAKQLAAVINNTPYIGKIMKIGLEAVKSGAIGGTQEYAKTGGNVEAAADSGMLNTVLTAGLGAGGEALVAGGKAAGKFLTRIGPKTANIAGEEIPVLASQLNESGRVTESAGEVPSRMAAQQQTGGAAVIRNLAQRAYARIIDEVNAARGVAPKAAEGTPQLPAPQGAGGFTFTMEGTPTGETPTGTLVQRAEKVPTVERTAGTKAGSPQEREIGSLASTVPNRAKEGEQAFRATSASGEELAAGEQGQSAIDQQTIEQLGLKQSSGKRLTPAEKLELQRAKARESTAPATTEPRGEDVAGGGTLTTDNPHEALRWKHDLETQMNSPEFKQLPAAAQAEYLAKHKSLVDQLSIYHASPYAERMPLIDASQALPHIETPGMANESIQSTLQPGYQEMNRLSNGDFDVWRGQVQKAKDRLSNPNLSAADHAAAQASLDEGHKAIDDMITRYAGETPMTKQYYAAMKKGWGHGMFLDNLDAVMERMTNGITIADTKNGLRRVMTGNTRGLEDFLKQGSNRDQLAKLMGPQAETNLKEITELLSHADSARQTTTVLSEIGKEYYKAMSKGAFYGGIAGTIVGHSALGAGIGGALGTGTIAARQVLRYAMSNPKIGNMVSTAVRRGMSAQQYAPLIARVMAEPFRQDAKPRTMANENAPGLVEAGNIPIDNRPVIKNDDKSVSSEYSVSFNQDGNEVLVPTVVDGRFLTPDGKKPPEGSEAEQTMFKEAWKSYLRTGQHLGKFKDINSANAYANELHSRGGEQ